jgi:hypothetical protein
MEMKQQNHFIRRWPRARRDMRGPDEYTEVVRVELSVYDVMSQGPRMDFVPVGQLVGQAAKLRCKKGYQMYMDGKLEVQKNNDDGKIVAIKPVKFIRVKQ